MHLKFFGSRDTVTVGSCPRHRCRSAGMAAALLVGLYWLAQFVPGAAIAEEPNSNCAKKPGASAPTTQTKFDAEQFIERLANHNSPPKLVDSAVVGLEPIFSRQYDWSEDNRIATATQVLVNYADEALPVLLKHFDDKRYSRTYCTSSDSGADNLDVGSVCGEIVAESLSQAFYEYIPEGDELAYQLRLADRGASKDLKTWCLERRDKPFYELQIEQCELAIDRIKHLREESADEKDKVKSIAAIKNQIEIMRRQRKPIQAVRFGRYFSERTYDSEEAKEIRKKHGEK